MSKPLDGKVAIVTGASRGWCVDRQANGSREPGRGWSFPPDPRPRPGCGRLTGKTAEAMRAGGAEVLAVQCDLSKSLDRHRLVEMALGEFGQVDILIDECRRHLLLPA